MAKKRTKRPFYGKPEQRLEARARAEFRAGNREFAGVLFNSAQASQRSKLYHNIRMMARRPIGAFMRIPSSVAAAIRKYVGD